jgi:hypothetical protein
MSATLTQARDLINGALKAAVDAHNTANSTSYQVFYDDVDKAEKDAKGAHFRIFIKHSDGGQLTLGGTGSRRFSRVGILIVQVMTPFGDGFTLADTLATLARNAFEGVSTPNGVWFRRVAAKEIGKTGGYYQTNVTANFEYTERR